MAQGYTKQIPPNGVLYEDIQQVAAQRLLGNPTGALANVSEIALGQGLSFTGASLKTSIDSATSFLPVLTFDTPGDLVVGYTSRAGRHIRIGSLVYVTFSVNASITHTTASGGIRFTGLPAAAGLNAFGTFAMFGPSFATFPAGTSSTFCAILVGQSHVSLWSYGSGVASVVWSTAQWPTGTSRNFQATIVYPDT